MTKETLLNILVNMQKHNIVKQVNLNVYLHIISYMQILFFGEKVLLYFTILILKHWKQKNSWYQKVTTNYVITYILFIIKHR